MNRKLSKILLFSIIGLFIVPQISFAAWYNPVSWSIFLWIKKSIQTPFQPKPQTITPATTTPSNDTETSTTTKKETVESAKPPVSNRNLIPEPRAEKQVVVPKTEVSVTSDSFQTDNAAIKIGKCKIEAKTNTDKFFEPIRVALADKFQTRIQDNITLLQQKFGMYSGSPQIYNSFASTSKSMCGSKAEIIRNKLKSESEKRFDQEYLECLNR